MGHSVKKGLLLLSIFFSSSRTLAITRIPFHCPEKFLGKVKQVTDSKAPFSSFPRQKIEFIIQNPEDSTTNDTREIIVVKSHGHQFKKGQKFLVEMNNNLVCKIKKM